MFIQQAVRSATRIAAALVAVGALASNAGAAPGDPYDGYSSAIYGDPAHWLCRPDTDDVCDHDLDATVVRPNGGTGTQRFRAPTDPPIDCFYVYPTISTDPTGNSDLIPGPTQELFVVRQQAARLGAVCRVFAPVYRQVTLTALLANSGPSPIPVDSALADADVLDAWKQYVSHDNHGRGVLLIGHSQGASRLTTLIRNEIDGDPILRDRLVSAMLLGTSLQVPEGGDVGGDFANVPLCRDARQIGCAISYASFRVNRPPPANSLFGRSRGPGLQAACTNPARLRGGRGVLHSYFPTNGAALPILNLPPPVWVDPALGVSIDTPFVTTPRLVTSECAVRDGFSYLAITVLGNPADPRTDDIGGDLTPEWGLHLADANLAMGDLVVIAKRQARMWTRLHP